MNWPSFRCKKFLVEQTGVVHPVGTDAMLLGSWVPLPDISNSTQHRPIQLLDIGTGTGIISLMLAQRMTAQYLDFQLDAIDIHAGSAQCASANFSGSPWAALLNAIHSDLQQWSVEAPSRYQLIVSNPPFFSTGHGAPDAERRLGRHDDSLTIADLLTGVNRLLAPDGKLGVILPPKEALALAEMAVTQGLYWTKVCRVSGREGKPVERVMLLLERDALPFEQTAMSIYEAAGHAYAGAYRGLTGAFYL
jgi:tRNA1Val (adenine37-N6)-methyltransferase